MNTLTTFRLQIKKRPITSLNKLIENLKIIDVENETLNKVQKQKVRGLLKIVRKELKNRNKTTK
jgi:hypothetical protein